MSTVGKKKGISARMIGTPQNFVHVQTYKSAEGEEGFEKEKREGSDEEGEEKGEHHLIAGIQLINPLQLAAAAPIPHAPLKITKFEPKKLPEPSQELLIFVANTELYDVLKNGFK